VRRQDYFGANHFPFWITLGHASGPTGYSDYPALRQHRAHIAPSREGQVGIDVAMEGLRECLRQRKATSDQSWRYATKARIWSTMKPYEEATAADGP